MKKRKKILSLLVVTSLVLSLTFNAYNRVEVKGFAIAIPIMVGKVVEGLVVLGATVGVAEKGADIIQDIANSEERQREIHQSLLDSIAYEENIELRLPNKVYVSQEMFEFLNIQSEEFGEVEALKFDNLAKSLGLKEKSHYKVIKGGYNPKLPQPPDPEKFSIALTNMFTHLALMEIQKIFYEVGEKSVQGQIEQNSRILEMYENYDFSKDRPISFNGYNLVYSNGQEDQHEHYLFMESEFPCPQIFNLRGFRYSLRNKVFFPDLYNDENNLVLISSVKNLRNSEFLKLDVADLNSDMFLYGSDSTMLLATMKTNTSTNTIDIVFSISPTWRNKYSTSLNGKNENLEEFYSHSKEFFYNDMKGVVPKELAFRNPYTKFGFLNDKQNFFNDLSVTTQGDAGSFLPSITIPILNNDPITTVQQHLQNMINNKKLYTELPLFFQGAYAGNTSQQLQLIYSPYNVPFNSLQYLNMGNANNVIVNEQTNPYILPNTITKEDTEKLPAVVFDPTPGYIGDMISSIDTYQDDMKKKWQDLSLNLQKQQQLITQLDLNNNPLPGEGTASLTNPNVNPNPTIPSNFNNMVLPGNSLFDKFPFCIPFDLIDSIKLLQSDGQAPYWVIPVTKDYTITLDFSKFESVVVVIRWGETLGFIIFLISKTRGIIKG